MSVQNNPMSGGRTRRPRCLIVDDDEFDRNLTIRLINKSSDPERIDVAGSLEEAKLMIIENAYDIVFFDHHLPDGFGGAFLHDALKCYALRGAAVYLLTSMPSHARRFFVGMEQELHILDKNNVDLWTQTDPLNLVT